MITPADFWSRINVTEPDSCWEWCGARKPPWGYGQVRIERRAYHAHRLAWEIANGQEIPAGLVVMHKCDNPPCCNPAHLSIGTVAQNSVDMVEKGRACFGERNGMSKLTAELVRKMRDEYAAGGVSQRAIAKAYGISQGHVCAVLAGRRWPEMEAS